jgi:hypothetical protein
MWLALYALIPAALAAARSSVRKSCAPKMMPEVGQTESRALRALSLSGSSRRKRFLSTSSVMGFDFRHTFEVAASVSPLGQAAKNRHLLLDGVSGHHA